MTHTLVSRLLLLAIVSGLAGCGGKPPAEPPPLSVADWKAMRVDRKYTPEALERLKRGDPKLETPEGWEAFSRTTLAEARRKDSAAKKRR
jgi:predicted small lipoprotein YifL